MGLPWSGGIEGTENGALIFALVAAFLYLVRPAGAGGLRCAIVKTIPVALFALIAYRLNAPWLLVVGLLLSALGDFFLAFEGEKAFLGGLASFLAAHVAYVVLFVLRGTEMHLDGDLIRMVLVLGLVVHAGLFGRKLLLAVPATLKLPVAGYVSVISVMGLVAAAYGSLTMLAGALLFVLSDTLLGTRNFLVGENDTRRKALDAGVWITYIAAQLLILFSQTL